MLRRRFVWRRFVEETFRVETFCMCAHNKGGDMLHLYKIWKIEREMIEE
jgi:hypothetical protein